MSPDGSTKPPLPEEKLLKLIREKGPHGAVALAPPAAVVSGVRLKSGARQVQALFGLKPRWVTLVIGGLSAVLAIELVVFAIQLMRPVSTMRLPDAATSSTTPTEALTLSDMPSLAESASHPLFTPPVTSAIPGGQGPGTVPSPTAKLLAARLTLTGIMAGNPGQAIIEDSQTRKTYFVTTGQAVVDGAVLEQVLDNRVILDIQGEKIELTL